MNDANVLQGTPYRILSTVGEGSFAVVYKAEHVHLGTTRAVKVLKREHIQRPDLVNRMHREAQILAGLSHPNLVTVHDSGKTLQGYPYIAMEMLQGVPLNRHLKDCGGQLPLQEALRVLRGVLSGLRCLHQIHVVHRDIKASNVYLTAEQTVKVLDLGIAKAAEEARWHVKTGHGEYLGTLTCMPPEQVTGHCDARADIYACGVLLYRMLSGRLPIPKMTHGEMLLAIFAEVPAPLKSLVPALPEWVSLAVSRALAKDPNDRFPSVDAMMTALFDEDDLPTTAERRVTATGTEELNVDTLRRLAQTPAVPFTSIPPERKSAPGLEITPLSARVGVVPPAPSSSPAFSPWSAPPAPPSRPSYQLPQAPSSSPSSCKAPPSSSPVAVSLRPPVPQITTHATGRSEYRRAAPVLVQVFDRAWQWVHSVPYWFLASIVFAIVMVVITCSLMFFGTASWPILAVFLIGSVTLAARISVRSR